MKTVIEKIIVNYFGKFINGINKENLSVDLFGGNFQLQNISLKQQYFDSLDTPFKLTFSSIGKLNLQAPLSKLSSTPVQCTLDNIYAVFEFRTDQTIPEQLSNQKQLHQKKQFLKKYICDMYENYIKKLRQKDQKKQDGMMAKLGKKIIDNLQLKIINFHVRFQQNKAGHKYAWGVTLQQISFMTTDNQWKPTFIDRLAENGKNQKLLKKMNLKNLSVYWQSGSKQKDDLFITQLKTVSEKNTKMASMVKSTKYSIISLTSEVKLVINQTQNLQTPLYQLSVDLAPIVFELQRVQVSQMIDFTQKNISQNEQILKRLSLKKKKSKKQLQPDQRQKLQQTFCQYVQNIVQEYQAQKEKYKREDRFEQTQILAILNTLSSKVQDQQILLWVMKPVRRKVKQARERQLKRKKKGWFGGEYQLNQDQTKALSNFVQQVTESDEKQRPPQCLMFSLKILVKGGKFAFINNKNLPQQQIIEFQIGKINLFIVKSQNEAILDIIVGVQSISLDLYLPIYNSDQKLKMNILRNLKNQQIDEQQQQFFDPGEEQTDNFIYIKFSKKIQQQNQKPVIKTDINGEIKQIAVTYKKLYMKKFKSFFTFKNFNQSMKNETIKKWQQMKQKNEQKTIQIQEQNEVIKKFNIQVKITSPLFVCPLTQTGGWCINLGKLSLQSSRDHEKQIYPIKVQSAFFRYYPNLNCCLKKMNEKQLNQRQIFCLVKDINFIITHNKYTQLKKQHTDINLPNFQVNFTEKQYKNLISLKDIFTSGDNTESTFFQTLKKQRQQVQKRKVFQANIQKKSGQLDKWRSYYGILSGQFIYLYGSQKQLKCLQKIQIKNQRVQYNQQSKIITLINQQGVTQLTGSQFENNTKLWKDHIMAQLKQFMTIYQIVQEMISKQQQKKQQKNRKRDSSIHEVNKRQKSIAFKIQKIGFHYKDQHSKDLMVFQLHRLVFQQKQQNKISTKTITIQQLQSFDYIHTYKNPSLQSLISTKQIEIKIYRNKNEQNKKFDIDLIFSQIYINWKPDVLVILMKLIYSYISKQIKHRVDDGQQKTRQQMFVEVLNDPKFSFGMKQYQRNSKGKQVKDKRINFVQKNNRLKQLISLHLKMKTIQVLMLHRQSHLIMFKMIANHIDNQLVIGQNQKYVSGSIKDLYLYEMTGYPRENYTELDKNIPYLIIKPKNVNNKQSLIQYKWSSYEPFVLPNSQRVNMFLYLIINPIQCHYFQQITFRLIDYILIQIILLLNQPQMLLANENLLQQLRKTTSQKQAKQQSHSIVKILYSQFQQIIRKLVDPYFMDMYFQLRNPSVLLKSQKKSNFYHRADLKNIIFLNSNIKNSKRFNKCQCKQIMKYIYQQIYDVICQQCHFYSVKQDHMQGSQKIRIKQQLLFNPIDISLTINKLIMQDEINIIYPQLNKYDRSFQTFTKMSKLIINNLSRQQYLLLNKLVNFNMVYDDNKDQCFIHNFKITKLLSPKPIYYDLLIPQIQLTAKQGNIDSDYNLFTIMMDGFKLVFKRNADLNSMFMISINKSAIFGYQYPFQSKSQHSHNLMIMQQRQLSPKRIQLMQIKHKKLQNCMDITVKMKTSGQKIIEMNIQNIQAYVKIHLFQLIFEWSLLEDWVFPTVSIYANDITFHLTIHNMSAWLKQTLQMYSHRDPRAFRLLGVFCYKFHRKANFSQQHLQQLMSQKKITLTQVNKMPQISYQTILLNTEVFHCLASYNLQTKRQVVQKITFNMIQKRYYKVANQKLSKIKTMTHRKMNLDKGLFKFSFTDIFLMQDILTQISKDRMYIDKIRQAAHVIKKQQQIQQIGDSQLSSLDNMDVQIQSLSLYLINNCRQAFIPILRIQLNNCILSKCNTSKKDLLKANFQIAISYFNPTIFRWQPMLEKVDLSMSKLNYTQQQQNIFASIEVVKPILINISKQMMLAIKDTIDQWNKKQPQLHKSSHKNIQHHKSKQSSIKKHRNINQTIQLVSQYVIRNEIGYPIQIYSHTDKNKLLYKIHNLQQIDYQYQLQKYDEDNEIEIIIGIEICHNKYKFKRITNVSLGLDINFTVIPQMINKNKVQTINILPINSMIKFITETKDSKRYLILKTTKWIQDYLKNMKQITYLPFDHPDMIVLHEQPHQGREVSLFKHYDKTKNKDKDKDNKLRYIAQNGVLKIMGKAMVYNYTPIPLVVNGLYLLPDQFVTISSQPTIQNMRIKDCSGVKVHHDEKNQIYYIYCEGYIIDYAGLYYQIQNSKQFSYEFINKGLKFNVYLLSDAQNKIKVKLQRKFKSTNNIKCSAWIKPAVGNQIFQLQNSHNSLCQYQTYGYLSTYTGNEYKDFKKIIQVTPFYVLSNTTNYKIKICQLQSQQSFILQPGERVPFFWENKSKPRQIKIAALKGDTMWGYSGPLTISHNTHSFVVRNTADTIDYRILSLQIQNTNTINFVHIIDCHPKKGNNIMLCNHFEGVILRFYQVAIFNKDYEMQNPAQYIFIVKYGQQMPFGYQVPLQKHDIQMQIIFDINHPKYGGTKPVIKILKDIQNNLFQQRIDIITKQNKKKNLLLKLSFEGNVKKLQLMNYTKHKAQIKQGQFICKIPSIYISLIGYQDRIRKQIINVVMKGIQLETAKTNKVTQYVFTIRNFQIQNCIKISPIFPIILHTNAVDKNPFLQFMITKDNLNSKLIHYVGVAFNKFTLLITSEQIQCLQETISDISHVFNAKNAASLAEMRQYQLFQPPNPQINASLYFIDAEIRPLKLNVTFKHVNNWGGRLIKTFASIDNCNLSVDGKKISHFSSRNISQVFDHLRKHYQEGIKKVILPMIGNLAILGSPLSLAQRIGSGFKDLIQLPTQGFNNGALEGGKGIAKGAGSFMKNTFQGTLNSFQSVTGSVGNGLSSLTFDDQFAKQRQKIKNDRSAHIGEGLANGAKSIANGLSKGVSGFFTQPVKGAQQSGIGGFFLGGLKGITGLVVKPVSGLFDATTKTFEGIKNTPSYLQNEQQNQQKYKRKRNPRIFYTHIRQFRPYDQDIAMCAKIIGQKDQQKYENLSWYGSYQLVSNQSKQKKNPIILLTYQFFIIHNLAINTIIQCFKCSDLYDVVVQSPHKIKTSIYDQKKKQLGHIIFQLRQPIANKLKNEIKLICNTYRPVYGFDYIIRNDMQQFLEKVKYQRK